MDRTEGVFVTLFSVLREDLRSEAGIGLALKAEGRNLSLRIRSERKADDEKQPYFAIVVGLAERDGAFRVSYKPSGVPWAESRVSIVGVDSTEALLDLVRRYLEEERRRLSDYQQET
jgi:hypothetical protein